MTGHLLSRASLLATALLVGLVVAAPAPLLRPVKRASTCNTPQDRACWTDGFDINTDWEVTTPFTGVVREVSSSSTCFGSLKSDNIRQYDWTITEIDEFTGPDGQIKQKAMLINGTSCLNASPFRLETDSFLRPISWPYNICR